jgi:hypothetical protein
MQRVCFEEGVQTRFWTHKLLIKTFSKVWRSHNKDPIVKLGSLSHNSLQYCAYLSLPWPWAIIRIQVMGNCLSPQIILFTTYNLGSAIFTWPILSWITHKNSSFSHIDLDFQVWYKLLHDSWCKSCFFNFSSYSLTSCNFFQIQYQILHRFTHNTFCKNQTSLSYINIEMVSLP